MFTACSMYGVCFYCHPLDKQTTQIPIILTMVVRPTSTFQACAILGLVVGVALQSWAVVATTLVSAAAVASATPTQPPTWASLATNANDSDPSSSTEECSSAFYVNTNKKIRQRDTEKGQTKRNSRPKGIPQASLKGRHIPHPQKPHKSKKKKKKKTEDTTLPVPSTL
mgnify:CR=1 FL=1|jgi:hypothetical protein